MEKMEELKKDISELQSLEALATRRKVKDILSLEVRKLNSEVSEMLEEVGAACTRSAASSTTSTTKRYTIKLNNYAWDQTPKFVKFYVTLPKVHAIPRENVVCSFTSKALELNVNDLENKDYSFAITKLSETINPELSNWKVKTDMVVINAAKVKGEAWTHVTELEKKASAPKTPKLYSDMDMDPNHALMSTMRSLYEDGDDEMKRSIAKAWSESQSRRLSP